MQLPQVPALPSGTGSCCAAAQGIETFGGKGKNWDKMEMKPVQDHERAPQHDADSPHPAQTLLCH